MIAYCLADFFNLALWKSGKYPTYADVRDGLADLVDASLKALAVGALKPSELTIRLYGGWYGEAPDARVPLRELTGAVLRQFPRMSRPRLRLHLAEAPIWDPALRLLRTLREVPLRLPRGKISAPHTCLHAGACSIASLATWWKGGCPELGCSAKLADLGSMSRQKMVDTLLTADTLTIVRDDLADIVLLASDDDDMLPALLAIAASEVQGIRLRRQASADAYYDGILAMQGIITRTW